MMPSRRLSNFVQSIEGSKTLAMTTKVAELRRSGKEIIDLGAGEPDFQTPAAVCRAGIAAIKQGRTKYTPNAGIFELRERIAAALNALGRAYEIENILVCCGAKHAIYNALLAVCDPGDEILIPAPYWTSYPQQAKMAGGRPVILPTSEETGFKISAARLEAAITPKTRVLILNSPSNPTGSVYSADELRDLARVVADSGIYLLSDEIYLQLVYDGFETCSMAKFPEIRSNLLLVNGFSKSHAMTGWRVGYLAADAEIIRAAAKLQSHSTSNISSISQYAALAAFGVASRELDRMRETFASRRDFLMGWLEAIEGMPARCPGGAFYIFPNISHFFGRQFQGKRIDCALDLADFLLEQAGVALVPGEAFGSADHIRISYANAIENLARATDLIAEKVALLE